MTLAPTAATDRRALKSHSLWRGAVRRFRKNRAAFACLVVLFAIIAFALVGGLFAKWTIAKVDWSLLGSVATKGGPALGNGHYFGVDRVGRDLFARVIQGIQVSLLVGILGAAVSVVVGTFYGAAAGLAGGRIDNVMMRLVDILYAIPSLFILILLLLFFGRSLAMLFIGIGLISWLGMARVVRGQTLTLKNREFIEAAVAIGASTPVILWRHIIPNLLGIVAVYTTLLIPEMILTESFISFLGLGAQEPNASLGVLISEGAQTMQFGTLWQLIFPFAFFVIILFCFYFVGDGLRDALDPKDR